MWEQLFGVLPPNSSITADTYRDNNVKWFDLYSESPTTNQAGQFHNVQTISEIDTIKLNSAKSNNTLIDPKNPPSCSQHTSETSVAVFRPCGHLACSDCLFTTLDQESRCVSCREYVIQFIGIKMGIDRKKLELMKAMEGERTIEGVRIDQANEPNVVKLLLEEDRVSKLRGATRKHGREHEEYGDQV